MKKFYYHFRAILHTILTIYFDFTAKSFKLTKNITIPEYNSVSVKQKICTIFFYLKHILRKSFYKNKSR